MNDYLVGYPVEIPVGVAIPSKELEILSGILERHMDRLRNIRRAGNYQESEKKTERNSGACFRKELEKFERKTF
jgi:hypothetical protein